MSFTADITALFTIFLLFAIVIVGSIWYLAHKLKDDSYAQISQSSITDAFVLLGNELKLLKEQLSLKERLAILGEVSAGITHELRNPLAVITGYLQILSKSKDCANQEIIDKIMLEVQLMNKVINELARFSKFEPLDMQELNTKELIKDVLSNIQTHDKTIHFVTEKDYIITGDKTLLSQAIKNVLYNAIDAAKQDIHINTDIEKLHSNNYVCISISDDGVGIQTDDIKKIFQPFYTTKKTGIGMGLALVQKIVLAHNGLIEACNNKTSGAVFKIKLPSVESSKYEHNINH